MSTHGGEGGSGGSHTSSIFVYLGVFVFAGMELTHSRQPPKGHSQGWPPELGLTGHRKIQETQAGNI